MRRLLRLLAPVLICICAAGTVLAQNQAQPDQTLVISGRREASEASVHTSSIKYIPFTVPAGATQIRIKPTYDWGPVNTEKRSVNFGVFDPRGCEFGGPGFRGWQGGSVADRLITSDPSARDRFYISGPIYPGTWNIMQRLSASTNAGLNYTYTFTFSFDGPATYPANYVAGCDQGIIDQSAGWYPGDMHLHTVHSDGLKTFLESIDQHKSQGYRFMVSTDHNTCRTHYEFADAAEKYPDMLLIAGEEWTTIDGHANVVGMRPGSWADFRVDAGDGKLPAVIDDAHKMNALFVINHPYANNYQWLYSDSEWEKADAVEVWNGNVFGKDDAQSITLWESKVKAGRRIGVIAGTDTHGAMPSTCTFVYAKNLSQTAIMDGLRKQHVFLSESSKGPMLILSSGASLAGDTVQKDANNSVPVHVQVFAAKERPYGSSGRVRKTRLR